MASDQLRKDAATATTDKEVVPLKEAPFTSLAEKAASGDHSSDTPVAVFNEVPTSDQSKPSRAVHRVRDDRQTQSQDQKVEELNRGNSESRGIEGVGSKEEEGEGLTLDEITNLRQDAQQKSGEALKALGERYQQVKDKIGQGAETTSQYLSEKTTPVKDTLVDKTKQAKDTITAAARSAADYTAQTAQQAKDRSAQTTQQAAEYTSEKVSEVKETVPSAAERVKEATVGTVQKIGGYVGEKAVAAKDMAVGAGKTTVGYTGKVAVDAKDRAVVAGWGVANYTTEKTVAATKAAAGAVGGVAGYVGGKAAGAKDTVTGYVGEKIAIAKDAVISAEESLAEYTARKKAEADREMEAKKCGGVGNEGKGEGEGMIKKASEEVQGVFTIGGDEDEKKGGRKEKDEEGVLQAIGETLVEIVEGTSKPFVVGAPDKIKGYSGKVIEKEE